LGVFPTLPPEYETWMFSGGAALARRDAADAVRAAVASGTLYEWAKNRSPRDTFTGRGEAYGVMLGPVPVVVRHARRGGMLARVLHDRYLGAPRFLREIAMSRHLASAGIATPEVVAAVEYPAGIGHRADVATQRVDGRDLATIFFGDDPPSPEARPIILREVGKAVRRLHDGGFVHPDLQLRNVLIAPYPVTVSAALPNLTVYFLDVDTCRAVGRGDLASHRANVARFARSWAKLNRSLGTHLIAADRTAFAAGYAERR
jgi:3-deoxy-D-manno-octulosonic acid kinase